MKIGIFYNIHYLADNKPYVEKIKKEFVGSDFICKEIHNLREIAGLDVLFVLGGDGTILQTAAECAKCGVKIIGINYGHVGFLAQFENARLEEAIELVRSGKYSTQKRSMLKITRENGECFIALNDLVLQRSTDGGEFTNTVGIRAEINGALVDNFSSDGVIVSTPTGSTAYSLSAGGSVLTPELSAFIMTPICAHSMHSRPVVFSDSSELKVISVGNKQTLNIVVDGILRGSLRSGESVKVEKSEYFAEFIGDSENFFDKLLLKLNKWSR